MRARLLLLLTVLIGVCLIAPARMLNAQTAPAVSLTVEAGFDGFFRDSYWMPVIIRAANDGGDVSGRLVVRPETSGRAIVNTYSTPITLAGGARQTAVLYVTARALGTSLRVEFIADDGTVVTSADAVLRPLQPSDRLYVVVSESPVGAADLTSVSGNGQAAQANWAAADLPERVGALDAVDAMLIDTADTSVLTDAQRAVLSSWVAAGGHLIVTGGASWQESAAGIEDLLPLVPESGEAVENLASLANWLRVDAALDAQTVIAVGDLRESAQALVIEDALDTPLVARWSYGGGTVDYLAASPVDAPLRGWGGLGDLWLALLTSGSPHPSWTNGFQNWEQAAQAAEILPGFDPLPDILPLCGFLALYIGLIGPINYFVLSRINRREWAWITIPALIILFSVLAYVFGANLRGNEATINRLSIVRAWNDSDTARVDTLVGLLSPRRTVYDLDIGGDALGGEMLRPIPRPLALSGFVTTSGANVEVSETVDFAAVGFTVDASFVAGFNASGGAPTPPLSGSAVFVPEVGTPLTLVRGSVRNDGDFTLADPVILARGVALHLDEPLLPGDVTSFELTLSGELSPAPTFTTPSVFNMFSTSRFSQTNYEQSAIDILSAERFDSSRARAFANRGTPEAQLYYRRQLLLESLIDDPYGTASRGDDVYLAGWSDVTPYDVSLNGAGWSTQNETLFLIELESEVDMPTTSVTIPPERFTWYVREQTTVNEVAPLNLQLQPGEEVVIRYTPLPDAVLSEVEEITVILDNPNLGGRTVPVRVFNYETGEWDLVRINNEMAILRNADAYLGANNAVDVRLIADEIGGFLRIGRVMVSQTGVY